MNHLHNNKSEQTTDSSFTLDIEQLLKQGNVIRIKPQGTSMYPLFVPGRDEACIERTDFSSLKRGDVILYRRDKSILVNVKNPIYRFTSSLWLFLRPLRPCFWKLMSFLRKRQH